ncbi:hypothetical protein [Caballeronia choica]|nr:hypothetical protein [Caballeronia choica]
MRSKTRGSASDAGTKIQSLYVIDFAPYRQGRTDRFSSDVYLKRGEAIGIKPMITKNRPTHQGTIRVVEMDLTGDVIVQRIKTAPPVDWNMCLTP